MEEITWVGQWEMEWPPDSPEPHRLVLWFAVFRGRVECIGVEIGQPGRLVEGFRIRPLTTTDMREIPLTGIVDKYVRRPRFQGKIERFVSAPFSPGVWHDYDEILDALKSAKQEERRGRKGHPPEYFEDVARVYREADQRHLPRIRAVADYFSTSESNAGRLISEARKRELLPPTTRGKPKA